MWLTPHVLQYDGSEESRISSLISYCDAEKGRSLFIEIRGDVICAGLKTVGNDIVEICTTVQVCVSLPDEGQLLKV